MTETSEIDPTDLLVPTDNWTAKSLRGRYRALQDEGIDVRCRGCNTPPGAPETVVAAFPQRWTDGDRRLLCAACWAAQAAEHSTLSEEQAELLAYKHAGLTIPEMSSATMRDEDEIAGELRQLTERAEATGGQVKKVQRTNALLYDVLG